MEAARNNFKLECLALKRGSPSISDPSVQCIATHESDPLDQPRLKSAAFLLYRLRIFTVSFRALGAPLIKRISICLLIFIDQWNVSFE